MPGAAEAPLPPGRWLRQRLDRPERHRLDPGDDHLGDPHAAGDLERLGAQVDQRDHELAPVVAVDRGRGVGQRDAVLERQAGPRPDLALEPLRHRDREAGAEQLPLERPQGQVPSSALATSYPAAPGVAAAGSGRPSPWGSRAISDVDHG